MVSQYISDEKYDFLASAIFLMFTHSDGMKKVFRNSSLLNNYIEKYTNILNNIDQNGGSVIGAVANLSKSVVGQTAKGVQNTAVKTTERIYKTTENVVKGTDKVAQKTLEGIENTANTVENAVNTSLGQTALTIGVGLFALQKIRKRMEKRKYIKTLVKENDAYYRCKTCSKLGYEIKEIIGDFFKDSKYDKKNVLYLTTDTDNHGLYMDIKYFDEYFKKEHLTPEGVQISINNLNSKGREKYGEFLFQKMKLDTKLQSLDIIPDNPEVIMVSYTYLPFSTKEVENNCNKINKLLKFGRNKVNKTITYNGNNYEIDAMVMSNFTKSAGDYLISGITNDSKQYIFIGSGRVNNQVKTFSNENCALKQYDWFNKNKVFCFKNNSCNLHELKDLEPPNKNDLCFNKTTGSRVFLYVKKMK
jgi:hypothetical protein